MNQPTNRMSGFWYLIALVIVGFSITVLVIIQVFVDRFQRPLNPRELFRPQTWKQMIASLPQSPPVETDNLFWWQDGKLYQGWIHPRLVGQVELEPEITRVFLSPKQDKLAWIKDPNKLVVIELAAGQILKEWFVPDSSQTQIVHWGEDNDSIFVAQLKETWSIIRLTADGPEVLQTDIAYPHGQLTQATGPISQYLVYPDCAKLCRFGILDIKSGTVNFAPALRENDPDARLEDLVMQFYDETQKVIAYQRVPGDEPFNFFVINFHQELIQMIELQLPSGRELAFAGYYPQSQEMAFVSQDDGEKEMLVYGVFQPALRIIETFSQDEKVRLLPVNNLYVIDRERIKSIFQPEFQERISQGKPVTVL